MEHLRSITVTQHDDQKASTVTTKGQIKKGEP